jgi:beta-lactamase class A
MKFVTGVAACVAFMINVIAIADTSLAEKKLESIENTFHVKIGVYAINTNNNEIIAHHADERFPVQSTSKLIIAAALLKQSDSDPGLLQEKLQYTEQDLMFWHPITGKYLKTGMTLEALAEAAVSYSDNTAMNLLMKKLGGPSAMTEFAHSIGNKTFNLEHYEGSLNSNPQNSDDTSTPKDMAMSVQKLTLGEILNTSQKAKLITWMRDNTVGYRRMRAGTPNGWVVADKTGSGDYGIANDIGILWSPLCKPIVLSIYTIQSDLKAQSRDDIVASTTKIVMDEFAGNSPCFRLS